MDRVSEPWASATEDALGALGVEPEAGLPEQRVLSLRERFGRNQLRKAEPQSLLGILVRQVRSLIVLLLAVGAGLSFLLGELIEGVAIVSVIVINTVIGFVTEVRAVRSMEALRELGVAQATVRRAGQLQQLAASELVVGDIVVVEAGDVVTADARLLTASRLSVDESTLTGESVPVDKDVTTLPVGTALADRTNMIWKGTAITRGSGEALVTSVGMDTELGRISALVSTAGSDSQTPLERRLERMGRALMWASLGFVVLIGLLGALSGRDLVLVIETAIALAVATVPEGLPIVATLALARGMWRMARHNALVEQLAAVETLGATSVILTDKTGTLTENRMAVVQVAVFDRELSVSTDRAGVWTDAEGADASADDGLRELVTHAALCTTAELQLQDGEPIGVGDPMEVALLRAAHDLGLAPQALRARMPEEHQEAFDTQLKMMASYHRLPDAQGLRVAVKGAGEAVLSACSHELTASGRVPLSDERRAVWIARTEEIGQRGLRVLAVARRDAARPDEPPYRGLTLLGLVALLDPPRASVSPSIATCQQAGVRVVMVTGDHPGTALYIARAVGIAGPSDLALTGADLARRLPAAAGAGAAPAGDRVDASEWLAAPVVARATPEQKLTLLSCYQEAGETVAMIGDGVNDAPALKQADIGVAMGQRGTAVAREASAMVLQDDDFNTIVVAIGQGRVIFDNIRKFVVYLLGCNMSEILVIGLASVAGAPLPLLPLQILFLNLVTDVFPALALGIGEGEAGVMERMPRRRAEGLMRLSDWRRTAVDSVVLSAAVLLAFWLAFAALGLSGERATTVSFLVLALAQVWHVFNMPERDSPCLRNEVTRNRAVWGAVVLCVALVLAGLHVPVLSEVLSLHAPDPRGWGLVAVTSLLPLLWGRLTHLVVAWRASAAPAQADA